MKAPRPRALPASALALACLAASIPAQDVTSMLPMAPADSEAIAKGAALSAPGDAAADPSWVRVGVIVASRRGLPEDKPLRYAYQDGEKLERLLSTVGQIRPADLFLLKAERREDLRKEAEKAGARVAALKKEGRKVFLQFYYTGHGAAKNFHFSDGPLGFDQVKEALGGLQADARIYVLDVCYGASFFTAKGFKTAPPVQLQMEMDKSAKGEVTISSSAGDEQAYEVRNLGGSIFTSHWIMALRGAGDRNRDGQVTLFEAYNYSYDRTSGYSAETLARPQHPSFQIDLTGARDVMLARLLRSSTGLLFRACPPGNYNVLDLGRGHQIGELRVPDGEEFTLALEPGRYRVQYLPAKGQALSADVDLPAAGMKPLPFSAFGPLAASSGIGKGPGGVFGPSLDPRDPEDPVARGYTVADFPGENKWRFTLGWGVGSFKDPRFLGNLDYPSETDPYFNMQGGFKAPAWRQAFDFDLGYSPAGLWTVGVRVETAKAAYVREAVGREPLSSLSEEARAAYPVNLRWDYAVDDGSFVFYAGRAFRIGSSQALSFDLGYGWVGRTVDIDRTVERTLYGTRTQDSRTSDADGKRMEASLAWWLFRGGNADLGSRATFALGLRLGAWMQESEEMDPESGMAPLDSKLTGVRAGITASVGRRRATSAPRYFR